jgi:hypothetical protein
MNIHMTYNTWVYMTDYWTKRKVVPYFKGVLLRPSDDEWFIWGNDPTDNSRRMSRLQLANKLELLSFYYKKNTITRIKKSFPISWPFLQN